MGREVAGSTPAAAPTTPALGPRGPRRGAPLACAMNRGGRIISAKSKVMNTIPSDGFLADEAQLWIAQHRQQFTEAFAMVRDVNRLAVRALHAGEPNAENEQEVVAAVQFARILTHFEATIILVERGAIASAKALLRVLCEAVFNLGAVTNDKSFVGELLKDDRFRRAALIEALLELPSADLPITEDERHELRAEAAQLLADAKAAGQKKPLGAAKIAKKAGLIDYYRLFFVPYSGAVHSSARDLDAHVASTAAGAIEGLKFGPDSGEVHSVLEAAMQMLFTALHYHLRVLPKSGVQSHFDALWALQKQRVEKMNLAQGTSSAGRRIP